MASGSNRSGTRPRRESHRLMIVDAETSNRLRRIRQRDTAPELAVRAILHDMGHRFRVANRDLPGTPDIANRARGWAVFVHGCFWHAHRGCGHATVPRRNRRFWLAKFAANRARDLRKSRALRRLGYRVVTVWECQAADTEKLRVRLTRICSLPTKQKRV
jgi:DNA mismatch endonuclease, patch repair protein